MSPNLLDNPLVQSILFYPRAVAPGSSRRKNVHDGTIPIEGEIVLGYRLYVHQPGVPVIVFFHGNGEIASDYDDFAAEYHRAGASLLVVDYRGYGWSTGSPKVSALLSDVDAVMRGLPDVLASAGLAESAVIVMGRSLGSVCAIQIAHRYPDRIKGLIIESGFAHAIPLLARLGLPEHTLATLPDPIGNVRKIAEIALPLLVIHGARDNLIPVANGQTLYNASPAADKRLVIIPGGGHNDLLLYGVEEYFAAIAQFISDTSSSKETPA